MHQFLSGWRVMKDTELEKLLSRQLLMHQFVSGSRVLCTTAQQRFLIDGLYGLRQLFVLYPKDQTNLVQGTKTRLVKKH